MSTARCTVVSLGTLDANELWGERAAVRTGHATTTLITAGDARILVDPGLPKQVLAARLDERTGLTLASITHVFLTSFHPDGRRGLEALGDAQWWISEHERESIGVPLAQSLRKAEEAGDADLVEQLSAEVALLRRCAAAPDRLVPGVDLFPLPGVTPGCAGLLLPMPRYTLLIAGDAVPTAEHLEQGRVLKRSADVKRAQESLREAVEIADVVIPGRDGLCVNPLRGPF
jgi:glyoxylase-like metal-dependent hydrolase (beta-lactamase superfamily II)